MNNWDKSKLAARCEGALGMNVRQVFDPVEIREILKVMDKGYLSPLLDPDRNDFTPATGFWLVAEDADGPQMAGGVRFDDLGGVDVSEFWSRMLLRAFGEAPKLEAEPLVRAVSGRTAYFGDLLSRGRVGLGAKGALKLRLFTGIGHFLTHQEFRPDVVYCFVTDRDAMRGAPAAYGFLELVPFLYDWAMAPYPGGRSPDWVALTRREQLEPLLCSLGRLTGELARKRSECFPVLGDLLPS